MQARRWQYKKEYRPEVLIDSWKDQVLLSHNKEQGPIFFPVRSRASLVNKIISCRTENVLKNSDVLGLILPLNFDQDPTKRLLTSDVYVNQTDSLACKLAP